ncbi:uncharacterized protein LOC141620804 [Silene latifolia]|uniref:uncharacterized protein LOC141620804 n=1 Tax=Silene latifolia TaxID=37657 RepID=UPI003D78AAEB
MCLGDYNEVIFSNEKRGGERAQWQMNNFRDAVDECRLRDISYEGYEFTFDNGQSGEDNRQSRIDRAMATDDWFDLFPYGRLFHLDREWSDHALLKVVFDRRIREEGGRRRKFRFEHVWVGRKGVKLRLKRLGSEMMVMYSQQMRVVLGIFRSGKG